MSWVKSSGGTGTDPNSHTHNNKATLDKISESNGSMLFNGSSVGGGGSAAVSKWAGKKWIAIGDSITKSLTDTPYHTVVGTKLGFGTVINAGVNGSGYFVNGSGMGGPFHTRISSLDATADLITVFGGTNDWNEVGTTFAMGTFGDTTTSTFYGALDYTFKSLITKYPTKTIVVFTPIPRDNNWGANLNSQGVTLEQVTDAIIKVCNKYSIPVLDLFRNSGMFASNATFKTAYMPDGLHPNSAGHVLLADKIANFLNAL